MIKLILVLNAFMINAPFNNPPIWKNPELDQAPTDIPQTAQQVLYEVFVPAEYTSDPAAYYNEHMGIQMPNYQHRFDFPVYGQPYLISHQNSHDSPIHSQMIHPHIPQHSLHVHQHPVLIHELPQGVQTHVHPYTLTHAIQPPMYAVHQHIHPHQLFVLPPTVMAHPRVQPQSIVQENFDRLEKQEHHPSVKLQDINMILNPESSKDPRNQIPGGSMYSRDQQHLTIAESPNSLDMKLQHNPSDENPLISVAQPYPMPEYEETIEKLYEMARAVSTVVTYPKTIIHLKKTTKTDEMNMLICMLKHIKGYKSVPKSAATFCLKKYMNFAKFNEEFDRVCKRYDEIIHRIPKDKINELKSIFPRKKISNAADWAVVYD